MSNTPASFQQAFAALQAFSQQFAGPIVDLLAVLERASNAEAMLAEADAKRAAIEAAAHDAEQRVVHANAAYDERLAETDRDHAALVAELNKELAAHRASVRAKIDALYTDLASAQAQAKAELETLTTQIAQRREEQRGLDSKIAKRQQLLADLTGKLINTGIDPLVVP